MFVDAILWNLAKLAALLAVVVLLFASPYHAARVEASEQIRTLPAGAVLAPADLVRDFQQFRSVDQLLIFRCSGRKILHPSTWLPLNIPDLAVCDQVLSNSIRGRMRVGFNFDPDLGAFVPIPSTPAAAPAKGK